MNGPRTAVLALVAVACAGGSYFATLAWQRSPAGVVEAPAVAGVRACCGLEWLALTAEQSAAVAELAESFSADRVRLEGELDGARERLAMLFEDVTTPDAVLMEQVDAVVAAHEALERRVAAYLLALRPHLTTGQRVALFQRCAEGVRCAKGCRWREGRGAEWGGPGAGRGAGGERGRGGAGRHGLRGEGGASSVPCGGGQP